MPKKDGKTMKKTIFDKIQSNIKLKNFINKVTTKISDRSIFSLLPMDYITNEGTTAKQIYADLKKVQNCSTYHENAVYSRIDKKTGKAENVNKTIESNNCNIPLLCSVCSKKLTSIRVAKYLPKIKELISTYKYYYLVTKTIDNVRSFDQAYHILNDAERNFQRKGQAGRGGEYEKVKASVGKFEVKIGENSKTWHIHSHTIVFTDELLDYRIYNNNIKNKIVQDIWKTNNRKPTVDELKPAVMNWMDYYDKDTNEKKEISVSKMSREWFDSVNDGKSINIDIRPLKETSKKCKEDNKDNVINQCLEALKYMSKTVNMPDWSIIEMLAYRAGKRFFRTTGELRGLKEDEQPEHEEYLLSTKGYYWDYDLSKYVDSKNEQNDKYLRYKISLKKERAEAYKNVCYVLAESRIEKTKLKKLIINAKIEKKKTGDNTLLLSIVRKFDELRETTGERINKIIKEQYKDKVLNEYNRSQPPEYYNMRKLVNEAHHKKRKPEYAF